MLRYVLRAALASSIVGTCYFAYMRFVVFPLPDDVVARISVGFFEPVERRVDFASQINGCCYRVLCRVAGESDVLNPSPSSSWAGEEVCDVVRVIEGTQQRVVAAAPPKISGKFEVSRGQRYTLVIGGHGMLAQVDRRVEVAVVADRLALFEQQLTAGMVNLGFIATAMLSAVLLLSELLRHVINGRLTRSADEVG